MMSPRRDDLAGAVRSIWSSRLGLDLRPAKLPEPDADRERRLIAVVRPNRGRGGLVLECPAPLARRAAAALRGVDPKVLAVKDVEDAIGELAALTGRRLWPQGGPRRPTPGRPDGRPATPRPPRRTVAFSCEGHVFRVTVVG